MDQFEISDDEEDLLLIEEYGRQQWLRVIVGGVLDKLTVCDQANYGLRRQRKDLMDACDGFVDLDSGLDIIECWLDTVLFTLLSFSIMG